MKLLDMPSLLMTLGIGIGAAFLVGLCVFMSKLEANDYLCKADYKTRIAISKAEELPAALSNAVECITSKGFVLTYLRIDKPIGSDDCIITAGGKDYGNVLKILSR